MKILGYDARVTLNVELDLEDSAEIPLRNGSGALKVRGKTLKLKLDPLVVMGSTKFAVMGPNRTTPETIADGYGYTASYDEVSLPNFTLPLREIQKAINEVRERGYIR